MGIPLTERQQSIYDFIAEYQHANGRSPKILEIQEAFAIKSVNGVIKHLKALEKKGWIQRDNTPRGIDLLDKVRERLETSIFEVPIFGTIPAGNPQDLVQEAEGFHKLDSSMVRNPENVYALIVQGESMIDAGIFEGDVVIVEKKEPKFGDIVVGHVDGESTLKRLVKDSNGNPVLKAENAMYPMIYPLHSLEVHGVVVYMIRQF